MRKDCAAYVKDCLHCQRSKITRHVRVRPEAIPVPARRFSHMHVDLVGLLPPSGGCRYLFTIIDRTTRWIEAIPLENTTTADCARALVAGWVTCFGLPATNIGKRPAILQRCLGGALSCFRYRSHHHHGLPPGG